MISLSRTNNRRRPLVDHWKFITRFRKVEKIRRPVLYWSCFQSSRSNCQSNKEKRYSRQDDQIAVACYFRIETMPLFVHVWMSKDNEKWNFINTIKFHWSCPHNIHHLLSFPIDHYHHHHHLLSVHIQQWSISVNILDYNLPCSPNNPSKE